MARQASNAYGIDVPLDEEAALRKIVEGVEAETGADFFRSLVRCVSEALGVAYAFLSELDRERGVFRTLAVWGHGEELGNFELPIAGTPCEAVLCGEMAHHRDRLQQRFPGDRGLVTWQVESYCGVPLLDSAGTVLGHLAIFDTKPMHDARGVSILRIFASRARAEVERLCNERVLRDDELRFRDLFQEGPVAYVTVGADGLIRQANRRAVELFGYSSAEEIVGRAPDQFCPDTPDGKPVARNLVTAFLAGKEVDDVELESTKADGSIFWVRVSLRVLRDAEGRITAARTALVDITDRKRAEEALIRSAELYRDLYDEAPVSYITIGLDGRIHNLNQQTLRVFGFTREQSLGREFTDFLPEDARGRGLELFARAVGGEVIEDEELESLRADGSRFWIRVAARPLVRSAGRVEGFRVTIIDVTERKRAEESLRQSESRYRDLYEDAPAAYWYADNDGRISHANRRMGEMLGVPPEQIVGRTIWHFAADGAFGKDVTRSLLRRFLAEEEIHGDEVECRRADGSPLWIRLSVRPMHDASGKLAGGRVTAVDVTAHKRAEDALRVTEYLREEINSVHPFKEIVGESAAVRAMLEKVRLVAAVDSSVLVLGETGTGKELVARAIHSDSGRRGRPLIKVNCAALPASLIESELFGHERGAFTGATDRRIGRFELADSGTIFLDEIGELPLDLQAKLLRILQERELERVGGAKTIRVDVRVIAATNRDLSRAVGAGAFRQDLYYRLHVFPIEVPPLRERRTDIPLLVRYFVGRYGSKVGRRISRIPEDVMQKLVAYDWPGNIRELENVVERAVILSPGTDLRDALDVASKSSPEVEPVESRGAAGSSNGMPLEDVERNHVISVLKETRWRIDGASGAAAVLRLNPSTLRSRMKKLGIQRSRDEA